MYALTENAFQLPSILNQAPGNGPHRRHRIGPFHLAQASIEQFNQLLARLGRTAAPLDRDQVVTAARVLLDKPQGNATPVCIEQRIRRMEPVARMIADDEWQAANDALPVAADLLAYLRNGNDLIPDWVPQVGRLDDAIAIETAWPSLADEVASYLDYRRTRLQEAQRRGCDERSFHFNRADWREARYWESELLAQRRRVRESSYAPAEVACFRIH